MLIVTVGVVFHVSTLRAQVLASTVAPPDSYCTKLRFADDIRKDILRHFRDTVTGSPKEKRVAIKRAGQDHSLDSSVLAALSAAYKNPLHTADSAKKADHDEAVKVQQWLNADSMIVSVFGNGNVKSAVSDTTATSVQGVLGVVRSTCAADFTVQLNVAAKADTIKGNFGVSILAPATGGFLQAGLIDFRVPHAFRLAGLGYLGPHFYASVSTSNWLLPPDPTGIERTFQATALGLGAGVYKQLLRNDLSGTFVSVGLDVGLAYRGLYGDLASKNDTAFRGIFLETEKKHFLGPEVGFNMQVGQLKGALHFYYFACDVPGLGRGQVVAGFAIQGDIIARRVVRERASR
jgi:hypothetical protein